MTARIRVTVVKKSGWKYLCLRWRDNLAGSERTKSAGTNNLREAERAAEAWEQELRGRIDREPDEISWDDFVREYDDQHLTGLASTSADKSIIVLNAFKESVRPVRMSMLRSQHVSQFQAALRKRGLAETTIAGMLKTLRAALAWGLSVDMLRELPQFPKVRRAKTGSKARVMKGRAVTPDEFEGMLFEASCVVGAERAEEWRIYLRGLWLSGLRLKESLQLWWDRDDRLSICLSGKRLVMRIPGELEKGNTDRILPIAPDFSDFLNGLPDKEGPVFKFSRYREYGERPSHWWVSHLVSKIGETAGIIVDSRGPKYASCHDLRRSFGERWARLVMPQVLMELMRHESMETTLRFYVSKNAETTADILWKAREDAERGE